MGNENEKLRLLNDNLNESQNNGEDTMEDNEGTSSYHSSRVTRVDLACEPHYSDFSTHMSERQSRSGSTGAVFPYDIDKPYETIEDLRKAFEYSEPPTPGSTAFSWNRKVVLKQMGRVRKLISRPRRLLFTLLPITRSLQSYRWHKDLLWDIIVGISLGTLQVPQGMAFATVAGIPLVYGLYIVWIPSFVYALFGGCLEVSYGPYALIGLLLSNGLSKYGYKSCHGICTSETTTHEEERYLTACLGVSFLVGVLFLMAAIFSLGRAMSSLLPQPVISGFIQASAILIIASQFPAFFQTPHPRSNTFISLLESVFENFDKINWASVAVGTASIVVYHVLKYVNKWFKAMKINLFIPEAIFVVASATAVNYFLGLGDKYGLRRVGHIPTGLPHPKLPKYDDVWNLLDMLQVAVSTGLISYIVTQSITTTVEKSKHVTDSVSPNRELVAYGLANIAGSIFLSLPCSASLSRAAIIQQMGAASQLHAVSAFIFLTLFLLFFPPLLEFLPQTVLSATIYAVIYKFIDPKMSYAFWKTSKVDFLMLFLTFVSTVFLGVLQGLLVGVFASFLSLVIQTYSPSILVLGRFPGTDVYRDLKRYYVVKEIPGIVCMRFGSSLHFANIDFFVQACRDSVSQRIIHGRRGSDASDSNLSIMSNEEYEISSRRKLEKLVTEFMAYSPPIEILLGPVSDSFVDSLYKSPMLMGTIGRGCYITMHQAVLFAESEIQQGMLAVKVCERSPEWIYRRDLDDGRKFT